MLRMMTAAAAFVMIAAPALAEDIGVVAGAFGARESVQDISISPSGDKIAYIVPGSGIEEVVYVLDLNGDGVPKAIMQVNEPQGRLNWCVWVTNERMACNFYTIRDNAGTLLSFTRLFSMGEDGSDVVRLTEDGAFRSMGIVQNGGSLLARDIDGKPGKVLMTRQYFKETANNTRIFNDKEGLGVDLVDINNGRNTNVEDPNKMAAAYIADEHGKTRIMAVRDQSAGGYDGNDVRYLYRALDSNKWEKLSTIDESGTVDVGFQPIAVDSAKNIAYGFDRESGFRALFTVALDGTGKRTLLMSRDDVDVDGLIRIGRKNRVIGGTYATEKRVVEYFDPEMQRLASGLAKALPGQPLISIADASADESKLLLIASSDTDPGMIYLFEKEGRRLSEVLPLRDYLVGREMGPMKPITYPARDGTKIPGYLTLPPGSNGENLPAIVLPHGGPGARDEWGFDWLVQFFVARGYAVLQPNFRGSAGYGQDWFGRNGFQSWEMAIGDVNDAGRWLVEQGIANPDKMAIAGWSYGGYAALQSQVLDPQLFKAVVAIAPVTDLELVRENAKAYTNFLAVNQFIGTGPHVAQGSPARNADGFVAPVLLVHGTVDINVEVSHSKLMKDRLEDAGKPVEYVEFEGLDHYLEHGQARGIMLKRIDEFLDASMNK